MRRCFTYICIFLNGHRAIQVIWIAPVSSGNLSYSRYLFILSKLWISKRQILVSPYFSIDFQFLILSSLLLFLLLTFSFIICFLVCKDVFTHHLFLSFSFLTWNFKSIHSLELFHVNFDVVIISIFPFDFFFDPWDIQKCVDNFPNIHRYS